MNDQLLSTENGFHGVFDRIERYINEIFIIFLVI